METFKNPSLTLYAFHLASDIWQDQRDDAGQLWQTLAQLAEPFALPDLKKFPEQLLNESGYDTRFLPLLPELPNSTMECQNNELSCKLYPLRLHDTYAVDFTVFFKDKILKLSELPSLNPNGCLLPAAIQASLGQTLLFYAEPVADVIPDRILADQCLQALWQQTELPKFAVKEGRLFGSPLFGYEEVSDRAAARATHVLVWFGTHAQTVYLATKTNNYSHFDG